MKRWLTLTITIALALGAWGCGDGARGPAGALGEQGPSGDDGVDHADGKNGAKGADGTDGTNGADGEDGADGTNGADGAPGADGADGAPGAEGPAGARGPSGAEGRTDLTDYVLTGGQGRTILTRGGQGSDGNGGNGESVEVFNFNPTGDIQVLAAGTPNTQFKLPTYAPNLGSNPKTISANTTFMLAASATANRLVAGDNTILGDDGINRATGLHVQAGVTLTLPANYDANNTDGDANPTTGLLETTQLYFPGGVLIEGTIAGWMRS